MIPGGPQQQDKLGPDLPISRKETCRTCCLLTAPLLLHGHVYSHWADYNLSAVPQPPTETPLALGKLCEGHWTASSHKGFLWENAPDNGEMAKNSWYHLLPLLGNRIWDPVPLRWQEPCHSHAAQLFCSTTSCWWARGRV